MEDKIIEELEMKNEELRLKVISLKNEKQELLDSMVTIAGNSTQPYTTYTTTGISWVSTPYIPNGFKGPKIYPSV